MTMTLILYEKFKHMNLCHKVASLWASGLNNYDYNVDKEIEPMVILVPRIAIMVYPHEVTNKLRPPLYL